MSGGARATRQLRALRAGVLTIAMMAVIPKLSSVAERLGAIFVPFAAAAIKCVAIGIRGGGVGGEGGGLEDQRHEVARV